jgi:small subunit ribosomal protein S6
MRQYEIMLILPADAEEPAVAGAVDRIAKVLGERGGKVVKTDRWGRRRFAHEIEKRTEGYYVVVQGTGDPASIRELDRVLHLADEVIRFKVIALPAPSASATSRRSAAASSVLAVDPAASSRVPEASAPEAPKNVGEPQLEQDQVEAEPATAEA